MNQPIYLPQSPGLGEIFATAFSRSINKELDNKIRSKKKREALVSMGIDKADAKKLSRMPDNLLNTFLTKRMTDKRQQEDKRSKDFATGSGLLSRGFSAENRAMAEPDMNRLEGQGGTQGVLQGLIDKGVPLPEAVVQARGSVPETMEAYKSMRDPGGAPLDRGMGFGAPTRDEGKVEGKVAEMAEKIAPALRSGAIPKNAAITALVENGWDKQDAAKVMNAVWGKKTKKMTNEVKKTIWEQAGGDSAKANEIARTLGFEE
jgi:hypothetical protein